MQVEEVVLVGVLLGNLGLRTKARGDYSVSQAWTEMGAFRPKRGSSPTHPQQQSFSVLTLAACRTVALLLLASAIGLYMLRFLPSSQHGVRRSDGGSSIESSSNPSNVMVDGVGHVISVDDGSRDKKVYLSAVIFNRVFQRDLFNITAYECHQWIAYMLFAGVDHVFWYDTAHSDEESQEGYLQEYIQKGILTYHRFHHLFPGNLEAGYHFEQDHSYEHFLTTHSQGLTWVVEMDVDEYPFMVSDVKRSFLRRYVQYLEKSRPDVTQILMPCMIFGGNPKGDRENGWVIERYQRRKRTTEGARTGFAARTKPIFQPKHARGVSTFDPHQFPMIKGDTLVAAPDVLRMNHYWGPRLTDFKADTPAVIALLVPDTGAQVIATELKASTGLTEKAMVLSRRKHRPS